MGAAAAVWPPCSSIESDEERGSLAMELRETVLFSRTSVCASEKAVPQRGGGSNVVAVGAGRCIIGSDVAAACGMDVCDVVMVAAAVSTATASVEEDMVVVGAGLLPSRLEVRLSNGVRLPFESMDGRRPGVLFMWFLDGGLSFGKRENAPPACGGPDDIVAGCSPQALALVSCSFQIFRSPSPKCKNQNSVDSLASAISRCRVHSTTTALWLGVRVLVARFPVMHATQSSTRYSDHELHDGKEKPGLSRRERINKQTNVQEEEGSRGTAANREYISYQITAYRAARWCIITICTCTIMTRPPSPRKAPRMRGGGRLLQRTGS